MKAMLYIGAASLQTRSFKDLTKAYKEDNLQGILLEYGLLPCTDKLKKLTLVISPITSA